MRFCMGTGEVVRYLTRHGTQRVARIVLIGTTTPMLDARLSWLDRRQHGALRHARDAARSAKLSAWHGAAYLWTVAVRM